MTEEEAKKTIMEELRHVQSFKTPEERVAASDALHKKYPRTSKHFKILDQLMINTGIGESLCWDRMLVNYIKEHGPLPTEPSERMKRELATHEW